MRKRNITLLSEPGSGSALSAREFFSRANVNATAFLDYYESLEAGAKSKSNKFWKRVKEGAPFFGVLERKTHNQTGKDYCWIEVELFRGTEPYFVVLFSLEMFDLLVDYHEGRVTINFTLQELLDEASRLEELEFNKSREVW